MRHWLAVLVAVCLAGPVLGQAVSEAQMRALGDALLMDQTLVVMQSEALANAREVTPGLFGTPELPQWDSAVADLFDPARARRAFDLGLMASPAQMSAHEYEAALAFYAAPLGQKMLTLEVSARTAMIEDEVEAAAADSWAALNADPMPASATRAALIRGIVAANDLIETNVTLAMNGNLAFYQGLAEAGSFAAQMSAEDMIREVNQQEAQVRSDTENWLYPYLAMAYAPLSDAELQAYIDFSHSNAGQALNSVLFSAFDRLGSQQSRGMGLVAGQLMQGQDI